jgi:hypothetical protein
MRIVIGLALLALGLLGSLVRTGLRERRFFDRPTLARTRFFDPLLDLARWILILGGLYRIATVSFQLGMAIAGILLLMIAYRRFIRSIWFQTRLLRHDYDVLRRKRPGVPEREILFELTVSRHPRWGPELIDQMILDYPSVETLAPIIVRMGRGFRGFRPS